MGISILELVLRKLRTAGFSADVAYPGQKYPQITGTIAAVHIEKVDRANQTVTVEVNIICPASMGGTTCEVEALKATNVLKGALASVIQNGCTYDGVSQVYMVSVLATFLCVTEADNTTMGPGFSVYVNDIYQPYVRIFREEEINSRETVYSMGEGDPKGILPGRTGWTFWVEDLIPVGGMEDVEPTGAFKVEIRSETKNESYFHCRWTSITREFSQEGLRRVRKGISMQRVEEQHGPSDV